MFQMAIMPQVNSSIDQIENYEENYRSLINDSETSLESFFKVLLNPAAIQLFKLIKIINGDTDYLQVKQEVMNKFLDIFTNFVLSPTNGLKIQLNKDNYNLEIIRAFNKGDQEVIFSCDGFNKKLESKIYNQYQDLQKGIKAEVEKYDQLRNDTLKVQDAIKDPGQFLEQDEVWTYFKIVSIPFGKRIALYKLNKSTDKKLNKLDEQISQNKRKLNLMREKYKREIPLIEELYKTFNQIPGFANEDFFKKQQEQQNKIIGWVRKNEKYIKKNQIE